MSVTRTVVLGGLLAVLGASGCSRSSGVDGDAYLRMVSGDVKPMADITVYYVPAENAKALSARMVTFCSSFAQRRQRLLDSAKFYLAAETRDQGNDRWDGDEKRVGAFNDSMETLLIGSPDTVASYRRAAVTDSADTDIRGHFAFRSLPPGDGMLIAGANVGSHRYAWVKRVSVSRGDVTKADLNNDASGEGSVCPG